MQVLGLTGMERGRGEAGAAVVIQGVCAPANFVPQRFGPLICRNPPHTSFPSVHAFMLRD